MRVYGVKTTIPYYQEILRNPEFRSGHFNTSFVESHPELTNYSTRKPRRTGRRHCRRYRRPRRPVRNNHMSKKIHVTDPSCATPTSR